MVSPALTPPAGPPGTGRASGRVAVGAIVLVSIYLLLPGLPAVAAGTTTATGAIVGIGAKCVDNSGGRIIDGNSVVLSTCTGGVSQQWSLTSDGTIRNQGHCLAVKGAGTVAMTPVWLYTCDAGPAQLWTAASNGELINPHSGLCLADPHGATTDGNPLWVYTCDGGPAQIWRLPAPPSSVSGKPMPGGDLPPDAQGPRGWRQVFTDDFTVAGKASATGALPDGKWWGYQAGTRITNSTNGVYDSSKTVSVGDGMLKFNLHSESGTAYAAVESPLLSAAQTYGRYDVRYRYEPGSNIAGFKSVWMTWPDDDRWGEGEIDFNEYDNAANRTTVGAYLHRACGNDTAGCAQDVDHYTLKPTLWHTATAIWSPGKVTAYVDGHLIVTSTTQVPLSPMHLLLQTEASDYGPQAAAGAVMNIDVDWVTMYSRK